MAKEITRAGSESAFGKTAEQFQPYLEKRREEESKAGAREGRSSGRATVRRNLLVVWGNRRAGAAK